MEQLSTLYSMWHNETQCVISYESCQSLNFHSCDAVQVQSFSIPIKEGLKTQELQQSTSVFTWSELTCMLTPLLHQSVV